MELPKNSKIIFDGIVGSQAYGLATETSDQDIKGVYIQSNDDILSNRYLPQIDIDKDTVYYELRRFLELVQVGNPNVLELLYLPNNCRISWSREWEYLESIREQFLSKKCYDTFSGYARTQLNKATGLNKKFNYEKHRTERKTILDFCKVVDSKDGYSYLLKDWIKRLDIVDQKDMGLVSVDGFKDTYKVYLSFIGEYRGVGDENTNEPRKSIVKKENIKNWWGILYFNREAYSTHCKEYREYQDWLEKRNEDRVATNKSHGQDYDGKNIMHTVRLLMTAAEIPTQNTINVDRTKEREYLLSIKRGEVDLKQIIGEWTQKANDLKDLYAKSTLKDSVDPEFVCNLELKIRNGKI